MAGANYQITTTRKGVNTGANSVVGGIQVTKLSHEVRKGKVFPRHASRLPEILGFDEADETQPLGDPCA